MPELSKIKDRDTGVEYDVKDAQARKDIADLKKNGNGNNSGGNVELDTTLTQSGKAADAKAVGDKIAEITGISLVEPEEDDIPKVFFGAPLQQTKDEVVTTFSYRSKTLSFDCYAEIKAQGNSTLNWPKKNQTVKLYKDAACTEKFKVDFKGWGKQNKFVIKANWRDLTHVRDIVSVRLEGDCMRSNPDYEELPELLKTSPNLGGIDGFPVVVYAAGIYQGRYMWNIPKDKWMTNMDDELDEHCILCSEDYNSSCFRAAANIDGNDWTDEIHDTVPASIKTRWNEIISFVINSTDDEFVANLDSHIKVSTLIDRHIMGLYSCDYDGYGKNQLYITYDGQQWYADRYDKDGTWGNYWTGNSMLPSNYGRDQYEDIISGRPGNLLFIRLEQLFYQRLQERWEYLKDNELSIPNTINRFRELYDITPPYVIDEDYASTTANGAFTGIPNKTTCTIQQIQKFVVERHAWMDEYMTGLTPAIPVPCTGITLDKSTLTFTAEGSQTLTATVAPDGCTDPVFWESSNNSTATVENGVVTAIANGSATITAKCGEYSASCQVSVSGIAEPVPCTGITLDKTELAFDGEGTQIITATVTPADTTDSVVWVSSAPAVASITVEGNVCTVQSTGNGNATITVACGDYSASCSVSVSGVAATLLYSLPEVATFDGVDDYIDTGVQLFDTAKDFTLLIRANLAETNTFGSSGANLFHCVKETSNYPGLNLKYTAKQTATLNVCGTGFDTQTTSGLAVTVEQGVVSRVWIFGADGMSEVSATASMPFTAFTKNLLLGCYQNDAGAKGRYWKGTIYDFKVWNAVLTREEIEEKLNVLSRGTLYSNYSPAGTSFANSVTVDWNAGSYIEAEIDLSGCTGTMENIFSIGNNITNWGSTNLHMYYSAGAETVSIQPYASGSATYEAPISSNVITVRFDKNGMTFNGTLITADNFGNTSIFTSFMDYVLGSKIVAIGSCEGSVRSNATYNYIRVGVDE